MRGGLALLALCFGMTVSPAAPVVAAEAQPRVLLFSHTTGYRHASIEPGVEAIRALGTREEIEIVHSENPEVFDPSGLNGFDAIIFLSSSTDPDKPETEWLQGERREALQAFVRRGGGIVGIHAASDSHYHWPWYQRLIGGHFARHPEGTPEGEIHIEDRSHPSTNNLPAKITRTDEWYYFDDYNPRMDLLVTLDPASIGEHDANPNPISWAHEFEGGRVFYTAMGHTTDSYSEPHFLDHLAGGLTWVLQGK